MANTKPTLEEIGRKYGYSTNNSKNSKGSQTKSVPSLEEIGKKYGYGRNKSNNGEQSNSVPTLEEIGKKYLNKTKSEPTQQRAPEPKLDYSMVVKYLNDKGITGASGIMTKHEWARRKGKDGSTYQDYLKSQINKAENGNKIYSSFYFPLLTPATKQAGPANNPQGPVNMAPYATSLPSDEDVKKSVNLDNLQKEIESLEDIEDKANKYEYDIKIYTNRANTIKHRGNGLKTDSVYDQKIKDTEAEYKKFLLDNGFEDINDLKNKIAGKKQYKNSAKYIQDRVALENSIRAEDDFYEYVAKGETLGDEGKNLVAYYRKNPEKLEVVEPVWSHEKNEYSDKTVDEIIMARRFAEYGTKEQIEIYNAYLGKGDIENAKKYRKYVEKSLNDAEGKDIAKKQDHTFEKIAFGVTAGFDQFVQGTSNLFNTSDEYIPSSPIQVASGYVRESLKNTGPEILGSSLGQGIYDLLNTTSNMLPSIGASCLANAIVPGSGAFVGTALFGGSAAGNSYQEKLNAGWGKGQARIYSTIVGVSEASLQYVLGGIGRLGGITGNSARAIAKGIDNAALRFVTTYGIKMTAEGFEEALQEVLNPFFENIALGYQKNEFSDIEWEQVAYSGMLGALSAGFLEGVNTSSEVFGENSSAKEMGVTLRKGGNTTRMLELASLSPDGSATHDLYSQYTKKGINAENISDLQLGRLFVNLESDSKNTLSKRKIKPEQEQSARATLNKLISMRYRTSTPVEAKPYGKATTPTVPASLEQAAREVVESRNKKSGKMSAETLDALTADNQPITAEEVKAVTRLGENGSKLIAEIANEDGITFSQAETKVKGAYFEGLTNLENNGESITDPQQKMAFNAGRQDRILQDAQRQAEAKNATVYDGTFHENEYTKEFSKAEKKMISTFAKILKMDIDTLDKIIANKTYDEFGNEIEHEANARHDDGKLTISNNRDALAVVYRMVLHESGHRMSQFATKEWGVLMNALYQRAEQSGRRAKLGVSNVSMFDMVKNQHDEAGISMETLSYIEEVAVRELETIFSSAKEFNKWYAEISANSELKGNWQKFCDWISQVIEDIKKVFMSEGKKAELAELERIRGLFAETIKASETAAQERVNANEKSLNTLENQAKDEYNEVVSHSLKKKTPYNEYNTIGMQWAYSSSTEVGDRKVLYKPGIKKFVLVEATKEDVGFIELKLGELEQLRKDDRLYESNKEGTFFDDEGTIDAAIHNFETGQNYNAGNNVNVGNRGTGIQNAEISEGKPKSNGAADTQTTDGNLEGVAENSTAVEVSANYSLSSSKRARLEKTILDLGNANIKKVAGDKEIRILTDQFSVNKAIYSKKGRTDREVNARIKAIPEFETIIRQSIYSYTDTDIVGLDSAAKKNVIAMHYFETVYNGFDVEVVIRDKGKKQFLYEVKFIENKKNSQQSMPTDADSPAPKGDVENDIRIPQNHKSVKNDFSLKVNEKEKTINESMTMEQAKDMIQRAFVLGKIIQRFDAEYINANEWLEGEGANAVALEIKKYWILHQKFLNKIQGLVDEEFNVEDIIKAYANGTLTGKVKQSPVQRLDISKTTNATDTRVFAPKDIKNAQETYKVASERKTNTNQNKVNQARADIIMFSHNRGAAEILGLTQSELNKKLITWARYTARAKEVSMRINEGASMFNRWTGIENSNLLNRATVSGSELDNLVNEVKGDSNGWQRSYIMRTILALDTHLDYSELNFEFVGNPKTIVGKSVKGIYDNSKRKITVKYNSPHTVSHEIGHFVDCQWARDFGLVNQALTDGFGRDRQTDADVMQFLTNFDEFIEQIENVADLSDEYTMGRREVFARFISKFVQWVDLVANGSRSYEQEYLSYNDRFTTSHFIEFAKLLQEKSLLDAKKFENASYSLKETGVNLTKNTDNDKIQSEQYGVMWTLGKGVLDDSEVSAFYEKISETKNNNYKNYHKASDGQFIYEVDDKLIYTDGDYDYPQISTVVSFNTKDRNIIEYGKECVYDGEKYGFSLEDSLEIGSIVYGKEIATVSSFRDSEASERQIGRGKGKNSTEVNRRSQKDVKSEFSLKTLDNRAPSEIMTEFLDVVEDLENGKKSAVSKLSKYVDNGMITTKYYDELIEQYGAIPSGERPHREVQVPKNSADGKKVSQTVRTILEAKVTPDEAIPTIEKMVEDGVFSYDAYTDKQAIEEAEAYLKENGWVDSLKDWFDSVEKGVVSKQHTAMGWALYNNSANLAKTTTSETEKKTAIETSLNILDAMVKHQRSAAQALQATRILKKLSPETQLYGVQKSVQTLQKEIADKYGKRAPNLKINEELAEQFLNAKTQEERLDAEIEIYKDIGRQLPADLLDKWNAWRYLAMLGNLRTHVRNILGNAFFAPIVLAKNLTATAIETAVYRISEKKIVRGKALITGSKSDKALLKAAWNDYANVADLISNGGKYNDSAIANQYIEEGRTIFKSKLLEASRKGNSKLLEKEDMWFSKPHYAYALAQYCKANNITAEQIERGKAIGPARDYAVKEAQKATYRDTNAFSQFVSGLGRNGKKKNIVEKGVGIATEGISPFRKTPANILVRGVEYSPLGLAKSLSYDLVQVSKGKMSVTEAIDNISAGLTGTGLLALGVLLAAQCLVRGHGEDDEKEKEFKELMGYQAYSLELPNGTSVTLDWLAPEAIPFFIGVNIWELTKGSNEKVSLSAILKSISGITEPLLETSYLQGINDVLESIGYAKSNDTSAIASVLASAVTSYLMQGVPTLFGQIERTSEKNRMSTYTEKNNFLTGDMQYTLGKLSAKIPFVDYQQIPYIDAWGRKEASGTALKRGFNNFLNPAYTSTIDTSNMEKELLRLYEKTGEDAVFPSRANKYFTVNGVRKDLTADEYVKYATLKGQKSYKLISDLVKSKAYKTLGDGEKVKAIDEAYAYADQKAKQAISNYKPDTWVKKADEFGLNVGNYISFRAEVSNAKKENGDKISKEEVVDIILDMAQNDSETWKMYLSMYDSDRDKYAYEKGIQGHDYMNFITTLNKYDKPTKAGKYGTYTQEEAYYAIKSLNGLSRQEKAVLWQSVNSSWKTSNNPFR